MTDSVFLSSGDPLGDHQIFWSNIFMVLVSSEEARNRMRLSGISQRQEGDAGWYIWRADQKGAYSLEIGEAAAGPGESSSRCWIKYYPALAGDPAFQGLSGWEKELRVSPLFDATGTPALEAAPDIPQEAFLVGYLDFRLTEEYAALCLFSQDFWQVVEKDMPGKANPAAQRCLPGWELAWPVADALIMAWCMFFVCRPLAAALTQEPGMIWEHVDGEIRALSSSECPHRKLFCFLPRPEGQGKLDPFGEVDAWFTEQGHGWDLTWLLLQPPDEYFPWANPDWWRVSQALGDVGLCCLADNR